VSVEIVDGSFLERFERLLGVRRPTVWLASPFLTKAMAQWLAALPACNHGDRRLLVSWDTRSINALYLSAQGVDILRESGFVVRDLPRLHAKMVIAGPGAYFGSGNLTFYGLNAGNTEIGVFADGSAAATAKRMFDAWWEQAATVSAEQISSARERQDELAKTRGWDIDRERQPGHQPPPKPRPPATELPDSIPAPAASPPAITHFWTQKTIAANQDRAGKPHDWFDSNHASAGHIKPGTRVYSVGWAPPRGLFVLNAFTVTDVTSEGSGFLVSGDHATPVVFNRVLGGEDYVRSVRIRNERLAPTSHMSFSPIAYLSQRTADRLERIVTGEEPAESHGAPQAWIKSQYYRHDGWTIEPGKEHWIGDPGEHDDHGHRIYRKDGVPAGEPRYKVGDTIGVYFGTTLKVPLIVEVIGTSRFDPEFAQKNSDGGEANAGERWPWVTPVKGLLHVPIDEAPDIDYLGIRGAIQWGRPHFRLSPERYQKLVEKLHS
jgi:hypothetical protein